MLYFNLKFINFINLNLNFIIYTKEGTKVHTKEHTKVYIKVHIKVHTKVNFWIFHIQSYHNKDIPTNEVFY